MRFAVTRRGPVRPRIPRMRFWTSPGRDGGIRRRSACHHRHGNSRTPGHRSRHAGFRRIRTREQFKHWNIVNSEDTLKYLPNLDVRKRFIGDQNSIIAVRGTSNTQSARGLVYADGLLLSNLLGNGYSFPPRWSMVFPNDIERVDVVYGPFSALYPGNAMGSTVLFTTRMPTRFSAHVDAKAFTQHFDLFGVDRNFDGHEVSATIGDKVGRLSYLLGVNRLKNTSQPMQFATLAQSGQPATAAATPVTGAHFYDNQTGQATAVLGISGEGIKQTTSGPIQAQAAL